MSEARHEHGTFAALDSDSPFEGVVRAAFSSLHSTVTQYSFEPGGAFPLHTHASEQITLILDGSVHMTVDGQAHVLEAGAWSVVPGGIEHGITAGPDGARFLAIVSPRRERSDEYEVTEPV